MARDVSEPCQFSAFHCSVEIFLGTDHVLYLISDVFICFVLQIGNAQQLPEAFHFDGLDASFRLRLQSPRLAAIQEHGQNQRLVQQCN